MYPTYWQSWTGNETYDFFSYDVSALAERIIIELSSQFKRGQF